MATLRQRAGRILIWGATLLSFVVLADRVEDPRPVAWDSPVVAWLAGYRNEIVDGLVWLPTVFGAGSGILLITSAAAGLLISRRRWFEAVFVVVAVEGAQLLSRILKDVFDRPRPAVVRGHIPGRAQAIAALLLAAAGLLVWLRRKNRGAARAAAIVFAVAGLVDLLRGAVITFEPAMDSFPSGHATASAALAVALTIMMWRTPKRNVALLSGGIFALATGVSRPYLGLHYPSDILGSWFLAGSWVLLLWFLFDIYRDRAGETANASGP